MEHVFTGTALASEKEKELAVSVGDDRKAVLKIGKEGVRIDRHTLPGVIHALQAASLEVV